MTSLPMPSPAITAMRRRAGVLGASAGVAAAPGAEAMVSLMARNCSGSEPGLEPFATASSPGRD